jgi:hypothetical protein
MSDAGLAIDALQVAKYAEDMAMNALFLAKYALYMA